MKNNPDLRKPLSQHLGAGNMDSAPSGKSWRGVFFHGPEPDRDHEGEEIPVWFVYVGDEEAEPVGKAYRCFSFKLAEALAKQMAKDRNLELINEAMRD